MKVLQILQYIFLVKLAFGVRQWVQGGCDKGFEETVRNRRKPYGGQPILQGVAGGGFGKGIWSKSNIGHNL